MMFDDPIKRNTPSKEIKLDEVSLDVLTQALNDVNLRNQSPIEIGNSADVDLEKYSIRPGVNLQDDLATQQSNWSKGTNAVLGGLGKTMLKIAEVPFALGATAAHVLSDQQNIGDDIYNYLASKEQGLDNYIPVYDKVGEFDFGDVGQFTRDVGSEVLSSLIPMGALGKASKLNATTKGITSAILQGQVNAYKQSADVYKIVRGEATRTINPETGTFYSEEEADKIAISSAKWNYGATSALSFLNLTSSLRFMSVVNNKTLASNSIKSFFGRTFGLEAGQEGLEEVFENSFSKTAIQRGKNQMNKAEQSANLMKTFVESTFSDEATKNFMYGYLGGAMGNVISEGIVAPMFKRGDVEKAKTFDAINKTTNTPSNDYVAKRLVEESYRYQGMSEALENGDLATYNELRKEAMRDSLYDIYYKKEDSVLKDAITEYTGKEGGTRLPIDDLKSAGLISDTAEIPQLIGNTKELAKMLDEYKGIYETLSVLPEDVRKIAFDKHVEEIELGKSKMDAESKVQSNLQKLGARLAVYDPVFDMTSTVGSNPANALQNIAELYPDFANSTEFLTARQALSQTKQFESDLRDVRNFTTKTGNYNNFKSYLESLPTDVNKEDTIISELLNKPKAEFDELILKMPQEITSDPRVVGRIEADSVEQNGKVVGETNDGKTVVSLPNTTSDVPLVNVTPNVTNVVIPELVNVKQDEEENNVLELPAWLNPEQLGLTNDENVIEVSRRTKSAKQRAEERVVKNVNWAAKRRNLNVTDTFVGEFESVGSGRDYKGAKINPATNEPELAPLPIQFDFEYLNSPELKVGDDVELQYYKTMQFRDKTVEVIIVKQDDRNLTTIRNAGDETNKSNFEYLKSQINEGKTKTKVVQKTFDALRDLVRLDKPISFTEFKTRYKLGELNVVRYKNGSIQTDRLDVRKMSSEYYKAFSNTSNYVLLQTPVGDYIPVGLQRYTYSELDKATQRKIKDDFIKELNTTRQLIENSVVTREQGITSLNEVIQKYVPDLVVSGLNFTHDGSTVANITNKLTQGTAFTPLSRYDEILDIIDGTKVNPKLLDNEDEAYNINVYPERPYKDAQLLVSLDVASRPSSVEQSVTTNVLSDEDWNNFVDSGFATESMLNGITDKVIQNEQLSERETAVYSSHSDVIENAVRAYNNTLLQESSQTYNEAVLQKALQNDSVDYKDVTPLGRDLTDPQSYIQSHEIFSVNSFVLEKNALTLQNNSTKDYVKPSSGSGTARVGNTTYTFGTPILDDEITSDGDIAITGELYNQFYRRMLVELNILKNTELMSDVEFKQHYGGMGKNEVKQNHLYYGKELSRLRRLGYINETNVAKSNSDVYDTINAFFQEERGKFSTTQKMSRVARQKAEYDTAYFNANFYDLSKIYPVIAMEESQSSYNIGTEYNPNVNPGNEVGYDMIRFDTLNDPMIDVKPNGELRTLGKLKPQTLFNLANNIAEYRDGIQSELNNYGYNGSMLNQMIDAGYNFDGFYYRPDDVESIMFGNEPNFNETDIDYTSDSLNDTNLC